MAPPRADLSPDKVEDDVMDRIPSLDAEQLEEVCGIVNLDVAEGLKGKRRELKKLLMKYLCTSDDAEDDDKLADFLAIHEHLEIGEEEEEEDETEQEQSKVKETTVSVKKEEPAAAETKHVESTKSEAKSAAVKMKANPSDLSASSVAEDKVEIRRVRVAKDFKLPGMIGGSTEHALSYTSLEFEIEKGRKLGFSDHEMCPTVISKIADKELKQYFETEGDMTLDDVLDMLKSACSEPESSALFTKFTTDQQGEDEKPI